MILHTKLNLNENDDSHSKHKAFWFGYAIAILENLTIIHLPKDYTIIEAGIFSEQDALISQLYNERKTRSIEDGCWVLLRGI